MRDLEFWQFLIEEIKTNRRAAIVKVIDSKGSSPGRRGFQMAVSVSGQIRGTIGGGIMENNILKAAVELINASQPAHVCKALQHKKNVPNASGLTCTGSQTVSVIALFTEDIPMLETVVEAVRGRKDGIAVYSNEGFKFIPEGRLQNYYELIFNSETDWLYKENYGRPDTVYVVGSGHVGLSVSKVFSAIGYYVVAFDSRKDAPTVKNNTFANEIRILPYQEVYKYVEEGPRSYVLVVTADRDTDFIALESLIRLKFGYIGLMGSAAKAASITKELREKGVPEEFLARLTSPIGIPISSNTPDEIAISIAAEIIKIKNS